MMSFSRKIGALPSTKRRVRWSSLVMTQSPSMTRSPGLSSIFRPTGASFVTSGNRYFRIGVNQSSNAYGGGPPSRIVKPMVLKLREQLEHRLLRLVRNRQGRNRQLLAGLQGKEVRAFLVLVGQNQLVGAGLQRVDEILGEILTGLNRRRIRAEGHSL